MLWGHAISVLDGSLLDDQPTHRGWLVLTLSVESLTSATGAPPRALLGPHSGNLPERGPRSGALKSTMTIDAKFYTPKDIALLLKVGRSRAYQIARELPHLKLGKAVRVAEADLQAWLAERTARPAERATARAPFTVTWSRKPKKALRRCLEDIPDELLMPIREMKPRT